MAQRNLSIVLFAVITLAINVLASATAQLIDFRSPHGSPSNSGELPKGEPSLFIEGFTLIENLPTPIIIHTNNGVIKPGSVIILSPTIPPWPTIQNTPTPVPAETIVVDPPQKSPINGVPWDTFILIPPEVVAKATEIFRDGQALGRNPFAYSKVGDSTIENPHFMARFDEGAYNLGTYAYLQPALDAYRGSHGRDSIAVNIGLHSWSANDPMWADPAFCLPNETPVQCEIRVHNPAFLLIRLGTNDSGTSDMFEANIRQIVDTSIAAGVIPVIGTKGDRHEGSNENNDILRRIAADYHTPLWDYDRIADTLPGRGLEADMAHMLTFYSHDYTDPTAFTRGHAMHNLSALMMLDALWREVVLPNSAN